MTVDDLPPCPEDMSPCFCQPVVCFSLPRKFYLERQPSILLKTLYSLSVSLCQNCLATNIINIRFLSEVLLKMREEKGAVIPVILLYFMHGAHLSLESFAYE